VKKLKSILSKSISAAKMVKILRTFALVLIIVVSYLIFHNWQENISLIGALGILISALLASYSVILNIDKTEKLKNREISNQVRNVFFHLCLVKMRLITLDNEKSREKISFADFQRIFDSFEDIFKIFSELKSHEMVSVMRNDMLIDLHMVYLQLSTFQTYLKSLRKSIKPPEKSAFGVAKYRNPLVSIDIKIDESIKYLTNILTYLRDDNESVFSKDSKGIEPCADYYYGMTKQNDSTQKKMEKQHETTF